MGEQKVSSLVTGGAASAGPPLGPALGPLGVNIMEVIAAINEKTKDFEGMKVPVTVTVDSDTKKYGVEVGVPSASALVMKEAGIQKGSGAAGSEWAGNISMDAAVKVARAKIENTYTDSLKAATKCVLGTCLSLGVKVEERGPREVTAEIDEGKWDAKFS